MKLNDKKLSECLNIRNYEYYLKYYNYEHFERKPTSFNNIGNICYCNVSLHLILSIKPLCIYLLKEHKKYGSNPHSKYKGDIISTLADLIDETYKLDKTSICTNKHINLLKKIRKYNNNIVINAQNDAHEFLLMLLDFINVECNRCVKTPEGYDIKLDEKDSKEVAGDKYWIKYLFKDNSIVTDLLGFQNICSITCINCGHTRHSFEFCIDLGLEIYDENAKSTTLVDLVRNNIIEKDEFYYLECNKCNVKKVSTMKKGIYRMPNLYMVIYIKRFKWIYDKVNYMNNKIKKIETNILLPVDGIVDFTSFANLSDHESLKNSKYKIESIICHSGNSYSGHYTAIVKFYDGFYKCNDEKINKVENPYDSTNISDIYLLLLKRIT